MSDAIEIYTENYLRTCSIEDDEYAAFERIYANDKHIVDSIIDNLKSAITRVDASFTKEVLEDLLNQLSTHEEDALLQFTMHLHCGEFEDGE